MGDIRAKILWWAVKRRVEMDKPYIIAVTGSIAKTSTKVAVGTVLRRAFPDDVRVGYGNLNSYLGVPLAILGFKIDFYKQKISWQWPLILKQAWWRGLFATLPKYLVLEYGADQPGDIETLAKMLPLDGAMITLTGEAHLANYASVEKIAEEKARIFSALKPKGWGLVNSDDSFLSHYQSQRSALTLVKTETEDIAVNFARAVGKELEIDSKIVEEALSAMIRPEGRLQIKDLGKIKLIDDSYNANPLSMKAAFKVLAKMPGRKVAILGDMLELGEKSINLHQEIGVAAHGVATYIVGVGPLAEHYKPNRHFADSDAAAAELLSFVQDGDTVLVKGSHGIKMDRIVNKITQYFRRNSS